MADSIKPSSITTSQAKRSNKQLFQQPISINDLIDTLLIEIFIRLPTSQSAHLCKCVCERWLHLISTPYFITRFVHHDVRSTVKHFTLLHQFMYFADIGEGETCDTSQYKVHVISEHPVLKLRSSFDLDFLSRSQHGYQLKITPTIVACDKDLVICYDSESTFYICNVVTKHCAALPPAPSRFSEGLVGFVTYTADSDSVADDEDYNESSVNEFVYSYKIIRIIPRVEPQGCNELDIETFSSENGEWSKSDVLICSRGHCPWEKLSSTAVKYDGKLHWIYNKDSILAVDPFEQGNKQWKLITLPIFEVAEQVPEMDCLGVCQERLLLSLLVHTDGFDGLIVWELGDYYSADWNLKYYILLDQMKISNNNMFNQPVLSTGCVTAFHPNDMGVLYLRCHNQIVVCNARYRTLEVISECIRQVSSYLKIERDSVFCLEHSCWTSPIPPLNVRTAFTST